MMLAPAAAAAALALGALTRVLMTDEAASMGAVCLSGTPGGFYYGLGTGADVNNWLVYFQGGGWCYDERDCYNRSTTVLGNSSSWPATNTDSGLMSQDCTVNPTFCNFSIALMMYCDGNSFSGNRDAPVVFTTDDGERHNLYFRGKRIIDAALSVLKARYNIGSAEKVLVTGCSAGGLATYLHTEYVHTWMRFNAPGLRVVKAAPMSGFFLDHLTVYGEPVYETEMKYIHALSNASLGGGLNADCVQHYLATGDDWKCNFAQYTYDFIRTPLFVLNSGLDSWQTKCIYTSELPQNYPNQTGVENGVCGQGSYAACQSDPDKKCNVSEIAAMNQYTEDFVAALAAARGSGLDGHGAFVHSCHTHCEAQENGDWINFAVGGVTMRDAVTLWWNSEREPAARHSYAPCLHSEAANATDRQCNPTDRQHLYVYLHDRAAELPNQEATSAFIHSCHTHCEAQENGDWINFAVGGVTMRDAVTLWWNSDREPAARLSYAPCLHSEAANATDRQCNSTHREAQENGDWINFAVGGVTMRDAVTLWWNSEREPAARHSYAPCLHSEAANATDRQCNPTAAELPNQEATSAFVHSCHTHCEAQEIGDWINFAVGGVALWSNSDGKPAARHSYAPCLHSEAANATDRQCNPTCGSSTGSTVKFVAGWGGVN
ncbi:Pectin acetylesterase 3 [Diplonema papillatum]|nr:Pectin acetylesterase 3 [Diplonema papillatum]